MSNSPQSFPPSDLSSSSSTSSSLKLNSTHTNESTSASVTKRLTSELMSLMMSCPEGISAFPADDGDLRNWKGRLEGAEGTYYEGHVYAISLNFPTEYPYKAPTVRFESTCYHPNVDLHGNICLDILKEKWSPMLSISTILISIQSLLGEPNNRSPLNVEAADLWDNKEEFKKMLGKHYREIVEDEA